MKILLVPHPNPSKKKSFLDPLMFLWTFLLFLCPSWHYGYQLSRGISKGNGINVLKMKNPFSDIIAEDIKKSNDVSELPNTFTDAVYRSAICALKCIGTGQQRIRIDFDTTVGDITYTSIKNTMPMMKELANVLHKEMQLSYYSKEGYKDPLAYEVKKKGKINKEEEVENETTNNEIEEFELNLANSMNESNAIVPDRTVRIFFPDMGAAALARRDWKMGSAVAEVPTSVFSANIQNDQLAPSDKLAILLCPLYSEADFVLRVLDMCDSAKIPCLMINPELINMDQGYGVRARNMRKTVINTFTTVYKLKTMKHGAVVREWPSGWSLWNEDASKDDGYRLLDTYATDPPRELVNDIYDRENPDEDKGPKTEANAASKVVKEVFGFFNGLRKL
jgi:hypothetical protein